MRDFRSREKSLRLRRAGGASSTHGFKCVARSRGVEVAVCSAAFGMNPIQSFHCKLRSLATVLDGETARLLRALDGEDSGEWTRARDTVLSGRCRSVRKTTLTSSPVWGQGSGGELFVACLLTTSGVSCLKMHCFL